MRSCRSIYRVFASLVIFSFLFIAPLNTAGTIQARTIDDPAVSTSGILNLPAAEPPDPPIAPEPSIPGAVDGPLSLDSWDPSQPIPLSLEEKFKIQEQFEGAPAGEALPEQLPPPLEPEHFPQLNPGLVIEPVQEPMDSSLPEGIPGKVDAGTPEITLPEGMNIQGSLVDAEGAARENVIIRAESQSEDFYTETLTDSKGRFAFLNLPTGDYRLTARSVDGNLPLQDTASVQVDSREALVSQPHELTLLEEVNLSLQQPSRLPSRPPALKGEALPAETTQGTGAITGTVTDSVGGPLENSTIVLYSAEGSWLNQTQADIAGNYTFSGLETGNYLVNFSCDYYCSTEILNNEYYDEKFTIETADLVAVWDGYTTAGIDARLHENGSISGRITSALDDSPVVNLQITITDLSGTFYTDTYPDSQGNYSILLPADTYTVYFYPYLELVPEYYNEKTLLSQADPVTVAWGIDTSDRKSTRLNSS